MQERLVGAKFLRERGRLSNPEVPVARIPENAQAQPVLEVRSDLVLSPLPDLEAEEGRSRWSTSFEDFRREACPAVLEGLEIPNDLKVGRALLGRVQVISDDGLLLGGVEAERDPDHPSLLGDLSGDDRDVELLDILSLLQELSEDLGVFFVFRDEEYAGGHPVQPVHNKSLNVAEILRLPQVVVVVLEDAENIFIERLPALRRVPLRLI